MAGGALWLYRPLIGITALMTFAMPRAVCLLTRKLGDFDISNAAALAAQYGPVSTATFFASMSFAAAMGSSAEGYMAAMVALMEFGVSFSLLLARLAMGRQAAKAGNGGVAGGELLLSVVRGRGRGILLLFGGMLIGYVASDRQWQQIAPFYEGLFRGMLMLFLLEMGITAARQMHACRKVGAFMAAFGVLMPVVNGVVGVTLAHAVGIGVGGAFVVGAICASASSIDASAACRASLPEANPGICLTNVVARQYQWHWCKLTGPDAVKMAA